MRRPKKILEQATLLENAFSEIAIRFLPSWVAVDIARKNWETGRVFCWICFAADRENPESFRFWGVVHLPGVQWGVRRYKPGDYTPVEGSRESVVASGSEWACACKIRALNNGGKIRR